MIHDAKILECDGCKRLAVCFIEKDTMLEFKVRVVVRGSGDEAEQQWVKTLGYPGKIYCPECQRKMT